MLTDTRNSPYAKVYPLPQENIRWTGGLINERYSICADMIIPHVLSIFDDKESFFHEVENFRIAAGISEGDFRGNPFGDGDFYKLLEGIVYVYAVRGDAETLTKLEEYVELISKAQQPDGYISTKQIIMERCGGNARRHKDINDFEEYNLGHLFTAACVHKRVTGCDSLLIVAIKAAEYLLNRYIEILKTGTAQTAVCPSHYMGLVELYRTTGDPRFLRAALMAIEIRDLVKNGTDDNQDRIPLLEHRKIVGHAVRSTYLYAGAADLYLETGDKKLLTVLDSCWQNLREKKLYITGGCGALYTGASPFGDVIGSLRVHQAFGYEYQLPNITAYNETCGTLGSVFWAYRMFIIKPQAKYFDLIERSVYNLAFAAVSLDGRKYFYENMLRRTKSVDYELIWPLYRSDRFECFCCPTNLARVIAELHEYAYMISYDAVYLGLYGASEGRFKLKNGACFTMAQDTDYPWEGNISFRISGWNNIPFALMLRVPEWVKSGRISSLGLMHELTEVERSSYVEVRVSDEGTVQLTLDMPVRMTIAHTKVEEAVGQVCVERGPLVYCAESPDTEAETLDDLLLFSDSRFEMESYSIRGHCVVSLKTQAGKLGRLHYDRNALYQTLAVKGIDTLPVRFIPYYAWDNRSFGEMRIWFPVIYRFS